MKTEGPVDAAAEGRSLRADARRNHEHITVVAREAFRELGLGVAMDVIARRAQVGSGTLYRHFPSREALIEGVYRPDVVALTAGAVDLAQHHDPCDALERWLRDHFLPAQGQHGVAAALNDALLAAPGTFTRAKAEFTTATEALVGAAQQAGCVRIDIAARDILRMAHGIAVTSEDDPDSRDRMLAVMIDGLRP